MQFRSSEFNVRHFSTHRVYYIMQRWALFDENAY